EKWPSKNREDPSHGRNSLYFANNRIASVPFLSSKCIQHPGRSPARPGRTRRQIHLTPPLTVAAATVRGKVEPPAVWVGGADVEQDGQQAIRRHRSGSQYRVVVCRW